MTNLFFDHPILNSPYEYPRRHWELDTDGQPPQLIKEERRRAEFITPIPKPRKRRADASQSQMVFDEGRGLSTERQQYDVTSIINEVRQHVTQWRKLPTSGWQVTPETARLLQHWRYHEFGGVRPFFCQVEAVETAIWLTEVAPHIPSQQRIETVGDDADLQEIYDTERHLPYVACTRARDHLLVTSVEPASEFLDDLRKA